MKIAIIHDYLNQYGGGEKVVETLNEIFPAAPVYTSIYIPENMPDNFKKMDIRTSFMQKLPLIKKQYKKYFLIYPSAFKSFDLTGYDVILSSSSAYAKGVVIPKNALHICYCYTPARFIWRYEQYIEQEKINATEKSVIFFLTRLMKKWDIKTAGKVDYFISTCENIRDRVKTVYSRDSTVIYPPVEIKKFYISNKIKDYFLVVSRLSAYKRIDIVIEAFNKLSLPLKIIGDGPHRKYLEKIAGSRIEFLGKVSEGKLAENYAGCQSLIFPGEEDFGIAPIEAMASGRPVIAYAAGGALETVISGITGVFFQKQTPEDIIKAVGVMQGMSFDSNVIKKNAVKFDKEIFIGKIKEFILQKYRDSKNADRN